MMSIKNQRIIIMGGNGFIGETLALKLKHLGFSSIIRIGRHPSSCDTKDFIVADISKKEDIANVITKGDIIVHLASSVVPATSSQNVRRDIAENLESTVSLLEVCKEKNIKKFIFLSSSWSVYGNTEAKKSKESDPTTPANFYGALKLSIEKYVETYAKTSGIEYTILRLGNAYGKKYSEQNALVVDIFIHKILNHKICTINGDGKLVRDYIYIEDVTDFIVKAIMEKKVQGVINLGTSIGVSLREIVTAIEKVSGIKAKVEYKKGNTSNVPYHVLNITRAKSFDWKPKYTLKKALEEIISKTK